MSQVLYLDTARLGQISPSANRALQSALEFSRAYGASAYFDDLLFDGAKSLLGFDNFAGLKCWGGIDEFKLEIKRRFFGVKTGDVILANRTASLMSLAAKMLFARCRNVLVADLNWNSYSNILETAKPNTNCRVTEVQLRDLILNHKASPEQVIETILNAYCQNECDGLFLPAVCNHGVQLPIVSIVASIKEKSRLRFSAVDVAQAINHADISWADGAVDFVFGGTHKWLRSFEPMAIGYCGRKGSFPFIRNTVTREMEDNPLADPLTRISQSTASHIEETVNLCPLFAAAGALKDMPPASDNGRSTEVRSLVQDAAIISGWKCLTPRPEFQSRILLLKKPKMRNAKAGIIRRLMNRMGVAVTDYPGGLCRISLPRTLGDDQIDQLKFALGKIA